MLDSIAYNAYDGIVEAKMAILNIRNLPEHVHRRLRVRAARTGRSMEAEARSIITAACADEEVPAEALQSLVDRLYEGKRPRGVVDDLLAERKREVES